MAINKNHEFDDLNGVKCAIVEKNIPQERVSFLQSLLAYNGYEVIIVASPPPKAVTVANTETATELPTPMPQTFTVGVTNVMFNVTNAIFGRLLKTTDGHVVTLAYWKQNEQIANDQIPYFGNECG